MDRELNGWEKTWFVLSALWAIPCVLIGLFGGPFGFFAGVIVGALIPAMIYVLGLAVTWIIRAAGTRDILED